MARGRVCYAPVPAAAEAESCKKGDGCTFGTAVTGLSKLVLPPKTTGAGGVASGDHGRRSQKQKHTTMPGRKRIRDCKVYFPSARCLAARVVDD